MTSLQNQQTIATAPKRPVVVDRPTKEQLKQLEADQSAVAALRPGTRMAVKARAEATRRLMEWHTATRAVTRDAPRYGIQIAGELLLTVMMLAERNPYRASLNTAVDIWGRVHVTASDRHGFPIPTAPRSIIGDKKKGAVGQLIAPSPRWWPRCQYGRPDPNPRVGWISNCGNFWRSLRSCVSLAYRTVRRSAVADRPWRNRSSTLPRSGICPPTLICLRPRR
jgi:hypothetical protein